jgi:sugar/nucleoside kinase (ribokinase family)
MVSTAREKVRGFGHSCAPYLDLLIVNDYEIGCLADVETRDERGAVAGRVLEALRVALTLGPLQLAIAHFPEGAVAVARSGASVIAGSVAMPAAEVAGVNGAGDAFAAGALYAFHEGEDLAACVALGHACAAASMREVSTTAGVAAVGECRALAARYGWRPAPA